jgi:hypothetical protein
VSVFTNTASSDRLYISTNSEAFTIPDLSNAASSLAKGVVYTWVVTTHGDAMSVDEMTDSSGFIDASGFSTAALEPTGRAGRPGTFTSSARVNLEIAP